VLVVAGPEFAQQGKRPTQRLGNEEKEEMALSLCLIKGRKGQEEQQQQKKKRKLV
jgi:hypothetical protein